MSKNSFKASHWNIHFNNGKKLRSSSRERWITSNILYLTVSVDPTLAHICWSRASMATIIIWYKHVRDVLHCTLLQIPTQNPSQNFSRKSLSSIPWWLWYQNLDQPPRLQPTLWHLKTCWRRLVVITASRWLLSLFLEATYTRRLLLRNGLALSRCLRQLVVVRLYALVLLWSHAHSQRLILPNSWTVWALWIRQLEGLKTILLCLSHVRSITSWSSALHHVTWSF